MVVVGVVVVGRIVIVAAGVGRGVGVVVGAVAIRSSLGVLGLWWLVGGE